MLKRFKFPGILAILLIFSQNFLETKSNELGEECSTSQECEDGTSGDLTTCGPENTCICNDLSVPNPDNTTCLLRATQVGYPCEIITQCTQGSLGNQSYCDLRVGNVCRCNLLTSIENPTKTKCLPIRMTIGAPCEMSEQCQRGTPGFNSLCKKVDDLSDEKTCQCDDNYVTVPGQNTCLQIKEKIRDTCTANIQCTTKIGDLSECQLRSRTCQCKENEAIGNSEETKCLRANVPIRQPCEETVQCVGFPNSVCSQSKRCDCLGEYVPSSPLDDCLPIVNELGQECKESQQCSSGTPGILSTCIENKCRCMENATSGQNEHRCRRLATYVGDTCNITAQCTVNLGHAFCLGNECVCLSEAVISRDGTKCLLKAYLGDVCSEDIQCSHVANSKCLIDEPDIKRCQCDAGYIVNPPGGQGVEGECMKLANFIGEPCEQHESQCQQLIGPKCRGDEKLCLCDYKNEVNSQDLKRCLKKKENLGEICEEIEQCQVDYSWCHMDEGETVKKCVCQPNFIDNQKNRCLPMAEKYNDTCKESIQCDHLGVSGELQCLEDKCQCMPPEGFHNKLCIKPAYLNEPCDNINECHFGINNLALCIVKPLSNPPEKWCQCSGNAMVGQDGLCYLPKPVGEKCTGDIECTIGIIGPAYCNSLTGSCTCENGYTADTGGMRCSGGNSILNNLNLIGMIIGLTLNSMIS